MKNVLASLLMVSILYGARGQNDTIDKLNNQLEKETLPEKRFRALYSIANYYYHSGRTDSMWSVSTRLLQMAQVSGNDSFLMASYKILGNYSRLKSDYVTALKFYFNATHLAETRQGMVDLLSALYNNIGDNYNKLGYYDQAFKYLKKAELLILMNGNNFPKSAVYVYDNIAETFLWMGKPDSALHYLRSADDANAIAKDNYIGSAIFLSYGMTYEKSNNPEFAEANYKKAIALSKLMQDYKHVANACEQYSRYFLHHEKYDSAKYYAIQSMNVSTKYNYKENILSDAGLLCKIYDKDRQKDSAYIFSLLKNDYNDSLINMQKNNQLLAMAFTEQAHEKEEEIKKAEAAAQRRLNIQYALIAIGLVSFSIFFLMISRTIIVSARVIVFLGEMGLLITFEFINLFLHPFVERFTGHSPFFMLSILVGIAAFLIPAHHRLEEWVKHQLVEKNNAIKIARARKTLEDLGDNREF